MKKEVKQKFKDKKFVPVIDRKIISEPIKKDSSCMAQEDEIDEQ